MFTGSILTALIVGFLWSVFRIVEYLISKKRINKWGPQQDKKLNELHSAMLNQLKEHQRFMIKLENAILKIEEQVKHLDEMHSVYDENLVPRWYLPSDMVKLVRQIHTTLEATCKEMENNFEEVKDGQSVFVERVIDLVSSQKIMVERLGDLINRLNRISTN
jgi:hypothetical protein